MKEEYILLAAVKRKIPRILNQSPYKEGSNDILKIELGYRHHDIYQRFEDELGTNFEDQGFYTSYGRFVDRYEGMYIAWKAKQVSNKNALRNDNLPKVNFTENKRSKKHPYSDRFNPLFSEDLY